MTSGKFTTPIQDEVLGVTLYPPSPNDDHTIGIDGSTGTPVVGADGVVTWVPDLAKIGMLDARTIVSRKKTLKLVDITSFWKRIVLERLEVEVLNEQQAANTHEASRAFGPGETDPQDPVDVDLSVGKDFVSVGSSGVMALGITASGSGLRSHPDLIPAHEKWKKK